MQSGMPGTMKMCAIACEIRLKYCISFTCLYHQRLIAPAERVSVERTCEYRLCHVMIKNTQLGQLRQISHTALWFHLLLKDAFDRLLYNNFPGIRHLHFLRILFVSLGQGRQKVIEIKIFRRSNLTFQSVANKYLLCSQHSRTNYDGIL